MKKICNIGGVVSGIISIIFSFVMLGMDNGSYESNLAYGGDAYTGIQNASAQAANNIMDLADIVSMGMFAFLLVFGIALICFFVGRIVDDKPAGIKSPAPITVKAENPPIIEDNQQI